MLQNSYIKPLGMLTIKFWIILVLQQYMQMDLDLMGPSANHSLEILIKLTE
nr:MAG TPA: hypothetical protein [Bacteriophage sp.]